MFWFSQVSNLLFIYLFFPPIGSLTPVDVDGMVTSIQKLCSLLVIVPGR